LGGARCHAKDGAGKHLLLATGPALRDGARSMSVLTVYGRIYAESLRQAMAGIGKNIWTLLLPMALFVGFSLLGSLLGTVGFIGGILMGVVLAAVLSCYFYFLGEVVAKSRVRFDEFGRSIGAYFWSVANVLFVFWIAELVVSMLFRGTPQGPIFGQLLVLAALILLNATPEVIYQRGSYGGLQTVQRSIQFLQANWIEWGIPNLIILAVFIWFPLGPFLALGQVGPYLAGLVQGALFHLAMVFRGHLFAALDGTSHRQRMYRWRTGSSP
jgi:hypothetical protein